MTVVHFCNQAEMALLSISYENFDYSEWMLFDLISGNISIRS